MATPLQNTLSRTLMNGNLTINGNISVNSTNIALGLNAAAGTVGTNTVAIGSQAGQTYIGDSNVAVGYQSGFNQSGANNTFLGYQAGWNSGSLQTGANNTCIGTGSSVSSNFTQSVAIGYNTKAGSNYVISIGPGSGNATQGAGCIAIGNGAGTTQSGNDSIAIGTNSNTAAYTTSVAIGGGATATANNQIVLGTSNAIVYIPGKLGINQIVPTAPLHIKSTGTTNPTTNGLHVANDTNTTGQHAMCNVRTGGASGGSPMYVLEVFGASGWTMGIDNSDSQKFKIANDWGSFTTTYLSIASNGTVSIPGKININGGGSTYALNVAGDVYCSNVRPAYRYYSTYSGGSAVMFLDVNNTLTVNVVGFDKMYIRPDAGVIIDNFTGYHRCYIKNIPFSQIDDTNIGLIVVANQSTYIGMDTVLYKGIRAITINESLPFCSLCTKEKDKSCFGVISSAENNDERIINHGSGVEFPVVKETGDTRIYINSLGEGAIWVSNKKGIIESGDYITTSDIPGYGMKQESECLCNYTVAKITMDCDFNPIYQPAQTVLKDASGNNILNIYGEIQWTDQIDTSGNVVYEYAYKIRYILQNGTIITKDEYDSKKSNNESVYIAAFIGCTYHCG